MAYPQMQTLWTVVVCGILALASPSATRNFGEITLAQALPQPDRNGDYFSNDAPLKRKNPPARLQAGSLWQVVSSSLNCRQAPGMNQPIVRQFQRGAMLEAEVGRGGSDEVLLNAKDGSGRPWMAVRGQRIDRWCYVRANHRYIRPALR